MMRALTVLLSMAMFVGCASSQYCDDCCDVPCSSGPCSSQPWHGDHEEPMTDVAPDAPAVLEDSGTEAPVKPVDDLPQPE